MADFWNFLSKKYIIKTQVQRIKNQKKNKDTLIISILKIAVYNRSAFVFFYFFYLMVPENEICLKYFLDKNPQI